VIPPGFIQLLNYASLVTLQADNVPVPKTPAAHAVALLSASMKAMQDRHGNSAQAGQDTVLLHRTPHPSGSAKAEKDDRNCRKGPIAGSP
jgi:hypothetical protein